MGDFHELKLEFRRVWRAIVPSDKNKTSNTTNSNNSNSNRRPPPPPVSPQVTAEIVTPGPRFCHVGVVYEASLYIFGGYDGSNRLNDFLRFQFKQTEENLAIPPPTIVSQPVMVYYYRKTVAVVLR